MSDDGTSPTTPEQTAPEDDGESAFWSRMEAMQDAALDRWAAKLSADIDTEEPAPAVKAGGKPRPKPAATEETTEDGATTEEPSGAEQRRAAGGVGPGQPSGYWNRVGRRILYGSRR